MKLLAAIEKANTLRPNAITDTMKADWIVALDGEIAEMMGLYPQDNEYPEDMDLLMPYPHDEIYSLYCMAMIDNAQEETDLYANDLQVANQAISEARRWWWRNRRVPKQTPVRVLR